MVTRVSADVLALVELVIMLHVLLHGFADRMVLVVVHDVSVGHVLGVYASTALDQWQLLRIQIFIGVGSKSSAHRLLLVLFVIAAGGQVRQLLLSLSELVIVLFLV